MGTFQLFVPWLWRYMTWALTGTSSWSITPQKYRCTMCHPGKNPTTLVGALFRSFLNTEPCYINFTSQNGPSSWDHPPRFWSRSHAAALARTVYTRGKPACGHKSRARWASLPHYRSTGRQATTTFPVRGKYFSPLKEKINTVLTYASSSVIYLMAL